MGTTSPDNFFPDRDMMRVGVYYYPEAWPRAQWRRDVANIRKLGLEFVHMGEFAWSSMEPAEGRFEFDWLEQAVAMCTAEGLKVILCTPSATPPAWLTSGYPDVSMVDGSGVRMTHGTRQHACWNSETYRKHVARIAGELGKRFGTNPTVWGWQIDNELSHYGKGICHCDACQVSFRTWLRATYETVAALNRDWGNTFWSQTYDDFEQIRLPNEKQAVAALNPHAMLDARRWFADSIADYVRFQAGVLREHCGGRQWVTTNYMGGYPYADPSRSGKDLDAITWTVYPVHGTLNHGPLGFRLGDPAMLSFTHAFLRQITGAEGIMELQPGQVNWAAVNPQPLPGAIYLWIMNAFASGAKFVCTYRYRQPLSGCELYHGGIVGPDGVTPSGGGEQFSKAARDVASFRPHRLPGPKPPPRYAARRTAMLYNFENRWDIDHQKQTDRWDTMGHLFRHFRALKRLGCPVDVVGENVDFNTYPFLVAPAYQLIDAGLVKRWTEYAERGGQLVLTCRTGHKDRRGFLWEGPWATPILDLIGADVAFYDVLPHHRSGHVEVNKKKHRWVSWAEVLKPRAGTIAIAHHADQFYAGEAAATTRALGRGSVTYIGVDSRRGKLETVLLREVFRRADVATEKYADGFMVDWRDGFWVAANFTSRTHPAPVPSGIKPLLGERDVPTAGVSVWQDAE